LTIILLVFLMRSSQLFVMDNIFLSFRPERKCNYIDVTAILEHATCNCPWEKYGNSRFILHTSNNRSCDLLIVFANARWTGIWTRLNWYNKSVGICGILGIRIYSLLNYPMVIDAPTTLFVSFLTTRLVRLHSFGWFRVLRNMIIIKPTLSCKLCGGFTGKSDEFKN